MTHDNNFHKKRNYAKTRFFCVEKASCSVVILHINLVKEFTDLQIYKKNFNIAKNLIREIYYLIKIKDDSVTYYIGSS